MEKHHSIKFVSFSPSLLIAMLCEKAYEEKYFVYFEFNENLNVCMLWLIGRLEKQMYRKCESQQLSMETNKDANHCYITDGIQTLLYNVD